MLPLAQQQHELQRLGKHGHILTGRKPARAPAQGWAPGEGPHALGSGAVRARSLAGLAGPCGAAAGPCTCASTGAAHHHPTQGSPGAAHGDKVAGRGWVRESMKESEFLTM
jgi:hypothetical protein